MPVKSPLSFKRIVVFAGVFLLVAAVIEFNSRLEELNRLNEQRDGMRLMATQAAQTQMALQTQVAFAASTQAVDQWARTEGHYVKEGDQPVVPVGLPGSDPVAANTPAPAPTPMQNWEVWWNLFFGR